MVEVRVDNTERLLRPGMFVSAVIKLGKVERVVTAPKVAVDYSLYGDSIYVVAAGGQGPDGKPLAKAERRTVQLGDQRAGRVAVLKGVKPGEEVVTAGQIKLQNGFPVIGDNTISLLPGPEQAATN